MNYLFLDLLWKRGKSIDQGFFGSIYLVKVNNQFAALKCSKGRDSISQLFIARSNKFMEVEFLVSNYASILTQSLQKTFSYRFRDNLFWGYQVLSLIAIYTRYCIWGNNTQDLMSSKQFVSGIHWSKIQSISVCLNSHTFYSISQIVKRKH